MEKRQSGPGTSLVAVRPRRRLRMLRRVLVASVTGTAAVGGALMLLPREPVRSGPPAPAPGPRAPVAVTAGMPAALPDLTRLIGDRENHLRTHPRDARAWAVLGTAYLQRGRQTADAANYPQAEHALQTSLEVAGGANVEALEGLAALANTRRDFAAAREWGEQANKIAPKRWTTYAVLIDSYTGLGDYKASRSTLDKLMALRTGAAVRPAVMARASAVYRDRGWREDAAAQLADAAAAARSPAEQADYLTRAGQLAWERGDRQDALRHFDAALRADPGQRAAMAGRGRVLAALGRTSEALTAYRAALTGQPSPEYALELGELYESLGRQEEAQAQYDLVRTRADRDQAGGVDEELLLGRFEADHGNREDAVVLLEDEWERQPGIDVADALGWALHRVGDDEEALHYARVATDKDKGGGVRSALYSFHLGMIEGELEQTGPARRHLQEALRINPYFSPLRVPVAREALARLGEPPDEEPPPEG
ncbi:tetratricopeptide repeat protein [Streptomyces sp. NPDC001544]|uniref:tetratricopeptide repeat protein n=1 Tax=Streptomyces sp. NPDC001544 TaxID=3364584 RepID=UPI00367496D5